MGMSFDSLGKSVIVITVVFIASAITGAVLPRTAETMDAFFEDFEDELGLSEPSIDYFMAARGGNEDEVKMAYSILGNYDDVVKVLVYHKMEIPPQLGYPDGDGIYSYREAEQIYPLYYRYNEALMAWEWSPDTDSWMAASNLFSGPFVWEVTSATGDVTEVNHYVEFSGEAVGILNYLGVHKPVPDGAGDVYDGLPSLTTNVANSLKDAIPKGTISADAILAENGWHTFTMELYISNRDALSEEVSLRTGIPFELGEADSFGVYTYQAPGATPLYYRFKDGAWQWTPYYPVWMPVTTTTVSNPYQTENHYDGQQSELDGSSPLQENIEVISYLAERNPSPVTASDEVPLQLGLPDSAGIYTYDVPGQFILPISPDVAMSTEPETIPTWYRYIDGAWQWTPYYPAWMPVTTTTVNNPYGAGHKWNGKEPAKANVDIINYLAAVNPRP